MENKRMIDENGTIEGFVANTGIKIIESGEGYAKGILQTGEGHSNPNGSIHGGMLFTLADTIGGVAAQSYGRTVTTVSSSINFLSPAFAGDTLVAETTERKVGKKVSVYDVTITNQDEKPIAISTLTFFYLTI